MKRLVIILTIAMMSITSFGQNTNSSTPETNLEYQTLTGSNWISILSDTNFLCYGVAYATNSFLSTYCDFSSETFDYHKAKVEHVVDGDTLDLSIDLGFSITHNKRVRLYGINAPEMKNDTNNIGHEAKLYLTQLIDGKDVVIKTEKEKTDKYGRYIVTVFLRGENINEKMVKEGKAERHNYE